MNHPTSVILTFMSILDYRILYLASFFMMLEGCIYDYSYFFLQKNSVKKFKDKIRKFKGELKPIDSELIQKYCKTSIEVDASFYHKYFPSKIVVYRQPRFYFNYYTFPIYLRTTFVFVKNTFDESEAIDRAVLAHELGHAFHAKFRTHKYSMTTSVITLQTVTIMLSLMQNCWFPCFISLIVNIVLFYLSYAQYEVNLETEADLAALKIIERIEGNDAMKAAAVNLLKMRFEEYKTQNYEFQKKKWKVFKASVACICPFIDKSDRTTLLRSQILENYYGTGRPHNTGKINFLALSKDLLVHSLQTTPYCPSA